MPDAGGAGAKTHAPTGASGPSGNRGCAQAPASAKDATDSEATSPERPGLRLAIVVISMLVREQTCTGESFSPRGT